MALNIVCVEVMVRYLDHSHCVAVLRLADQLVICLDRAKTFLSASKVYQR